MDDIFLNFQSPPDEDTLSFRDFPVTPQNILHVQENHHHRSFSQPSSEFFEFLTDFANSEKFMSHAEDIIFCGKLVPFKDHYHEEKHQMPQGNIRQRRSDSMSELNSSNNSSPLVMRTSRSLDDNKLNRNKKLSIDGMSQPEGIHRSNSGKSKVPKTPRWLVLMFGAFKFPQPPPEMDLREIKSRKVRRTGSTSFSARNMMSVEQSDRRSSWGVLDVLGC